MNKLIKSKVLFLLSLIGLSAFLFISYTPVKATISDGMGLPSVSRLEITSPAKLIDSNNQTLNGNLPVGSSWILWSAKQIDKENPSTDSNNMMYQVSSNGYVTGDNAYVFRLVNEIIKTNQNNGNYIKLYDHTGKLIANRGLAPNTSWRTDQVIEGSSNAGYRVATDEFVKFTDAEPVSQ